MDSKKSGNAPSTVEPALLTYQQKLAAFMLAYSGYIKGKRVPRGAVTLAAQKAGVSRYSIYVWLKIPEFVEEIDRMTAEGIFKGWDGLFLGAQNGDAGAANSLLNRLLKNEDPRIRLERLRHKNRTEDRAKEHEYAKELIQLKAQLGMPLDDEPVHANIIIEEAGMPPPPEERH